MAHKFRKSPPVCLVTSIIPMLLITGFPDFQTKIYAVNKENGFWQGMYRWKNQLNLGGVQETLLLPLWGRAVETQKPNPLLVDHKAVSIINSIPYDFNVFSKNIKKIVQAGWIARSLFFDNQIKAFIKVNPEATIVNIGCGLDTTFDRVDNGNIQWIDLDLPDTIELRLFSTIFHLLE